MGRVITPGWKARAPLPRAVLAPPYTMQVGFQLQLYARRRIGIWADEGLNPARAVLQSSRAEALNRAVIDGAGRDAANRACTDHMRRIYGIWGGVATQST